MPTELNFDSSEERIVIIMLNALGFIEDSSLMKESISYYDVVINIEDKKAIIVSLEKRKFCYYN